MSLSYLRRKHWLALAVTAGSLGAAALTIRPQSIEDPRYQGLLVNAPAIGFYQHLGFRELARVGAGRDGCIYMGKPLGQPGSGGIPAPPEFRAKSVTTHQAGGST